jgi:type II secretory pathway component PulJ
MAGQHATARAQDAPGASGGGQPESGFTLIEVLAGLFLTSVVVTVAISFYINLSDSSSRAAEIVRSAIHATSMLDRIARDVGGARLLVKPDETDPLDHPWFFVAENRYGWQGADRIMFVTRAQKARASAYHVSDLAVVAYFTVPEEDESLTLYRWASPGLPLAYRPDFPMLQDDRSQILGEGLKSFAITFLGDDGEWVGEWDSTQIVESSELPFAVEISISMLDNRGGEQDDFLADEESTVYYTRTLALPMRPLDLEAMILAKLEGETAGIAGTDDTDDDTATGECTVGEILAVDANFAQCVAQYDEYAGSGGNGVCGGLLGSQLKPSEVNLPFPMPPCP